MAITRPSYKECALGNIQAFGAGLAALLFESLWFSYDPNILEYFLAILAAIVGLKWGWFAFVNFYTDYMNRRAWLKAHEPATEKFDGRWATRQERADAGMYEAKGQLLGYDEEGYLLFTPHKLKPSFQYILSPQGGGKTSTRVIFSSLLSALIQKRDRRTGNV